MSSGLDRTNELMDELLQSKRDLVDALVSKGEEADVNDSFIRLIQKAADYIPKSYVLVDETGREINGVLVDQYTVFDATPNDVREGKTYAGELGVKTGTKEIPSYQTQEGVKVIRPGKQFTITHKNYDYTKLQALICLFNTSLTDSVATEKVAIDENVYTVQSSNPISVITKEPDTVTINLGVTNESTEEQVLRFIYYKEEY